MIKADHSDDYQNILEQCEVTVNQLLEIGFEFHDTEIRLIHDFLKVISDQKDRQINFKDTISTSRVNVRITELEENDLE